MKLYAAVVVVGQSPQFSDGQLENGVIELLAFESDEAAQRHSERWVAAAKTHSCFMYELSALDKLRGSKLSDQKAR